MKKVIIDILTVLLLTLSASTALCAQNHVPSNFYPLKSYHYSPFGKVTNYDGNNDYFAETVYSNYIGYTGRKLDAKTGRWFTNQESVGRHLEDDKSAH